MRKQFYVEKDAGQWHPWARVLRFAASEEDIPETELQSSAGVCVAWSWSWPVTGWSASTLRAAPGHTLVPWIPGMMECCYKSETHALLTSGTSRPDFWPEGWSYLGAISTSKCSAFAREIFRELNDPSAIANDLSNIAIVKPDKEAEGRGVVVVRSEDGLARALLKSGPALV